MSFFVTYSRAFLTLLSCFKVPSTTFKLHYSSGSKIVKILRLLKKYIFSFSVLKKAFDAFDQEKRGCISVNMVGTILSMLGHALTESMLADVIAEVDADRKYSRLPITLSLELNHWK